MRTANPAPDLRFRPPTGRCYGCNRTVTGERKLCGTCSARRWS